MDNMLLGNYLKINDTSFTENVAQAPGGGVFLEIQFGKLIMSNVTFGNCRSIQSVGGGLYIEVTKKSRVVVERSLFLNNLSPITVGGALFISMPSDEREDPGCIKEGLSHEKFPKWDYNNKPLFESTTFQDNTALIGGAVHLQNGETTFQNCFFVDNFCISCWRIKLCSGGLN